MFRACHATVTHASAALHVSFGTNRPIRDQHRRTMEYVNNRRSSALTLPLVAGVAAASALVKPIAGAAKGVRRSMGVRPSGFASPQYRDGAFHNRLPSDVVASGNQS